MFCSQVGYALGSICSAAIVFSRLNIFEVYDIIRKIIVKRRVYAAYDCSMRR